MFNNKNITVEKIKELIKAVKKEIVGDITNDEEQFDESLKDIGEQECYILALEKFADKLIDTIDDELID